MAFKFKKGKTWCIGYVDEHGTQRRKATRARGAMEAQRLADDKERKCERIRLGLEEPTRDDIPYRKGVALYLASLPMEYASRKALEGRFENRILPHLGKIACRQVTPADVRRMLAANDDCSPQTREHLRVAVQGSFTFLIRQEKLVAGENPAAELGKVPIPKRAPRYLQAKDIPKLLEAVPEQYRALFTFALATGCRKGELFALLREDIELERGFALIEKSHGRDTTKGGRSRVVPLPSGLVALLREHLGSHTSRYAFPAPDGERQPEWVALHRIMKSALKRAGLVNGYAARCVSRRHIRACDFREERSAPGSNACPQCGQASLQVEGIPLPLTFHSLRATWATWAYARTRDVRFVQQVLGHADVRVTEERYSHVLAEHFLERAEQVGLLPAHGSLPGVRTSKAVPQGALLGNPEVGKS